MPWHKKARKDVASCDKPRVAAYKLRSGGFRMGQPSILKAYYPKGGQPGELKHLSTQRKRK